ncbi:MAG: hypothetical protein ABSC94_08355 [Polyangiaceae bacterium]
MAAVIRVRDVVRRDVYDLGPQEPILRGPYDLFAPVGAVRRQGALVEWLEAGVHRNGRVAPAALGETHPGERVLVRFSADVADEWWLCEVEEVDGVSAA